VLRPHFTLRRFGQGYRCDEVGAWLDLAERWLGEA
jgi:hypothetical protein